MNSPRRVGLSLFAFVLTLPLVAGRVAPAAGGHETLSVLGAPATAVSTVPPGGTTAGSGRAVRIAPASPPLPLSLTARTVTL